MLISPVFGMAQPAKLQSMQLDSLFETWFRPDEPGAAVLLVKDNEVVYQKGFGVADMVTREPITAKPLWRMVS